ncbi:TonB-dependent receptor [Nitrincola lacisaponensis]|uniref:TonB-dependent receptor n=1 Tax=Nitrincola lacisaponensis TaxID=267850 RepID=A0A063Y4E5_9GAMM|nr:TonB-dependent receptor [Nitrincola lacisaponensis]KDE39985.1 TonB-dependent receptor [Nitrincola lacisaponensis]
MSETFNQSTNRIGLQPNRLFQCCAMATIAWLGTSQVYANDTQPQRLDSVVVSASGFEQDASQAPASVTVITRDTLERENITSIADALARIEGVNTRSLDARDGKTGNQTISLRGLPSRYTLVLIDGVKQNLSATVAPNSFGDSQSVFFPPVQAIERIEVIRGPMSTLYGSDAIGGVVNIITRNPGVDWERSVTVSTQQYQSSKFGSVQTVEGYAAGALNDMVGLQFYGRVLDRSASNVRIPGTTPSLTDNRTMGQNPTQSDVYTFGGRAVITPDAQNEITLRFDTTRQSLDNSIGQVGRLNGVTDTPASYTRGYSRELEFERDQFRIGHMGEYGIGLLETSLTHDKVVTKGRTINSGAVPDASRNGTHRTLELKTLVLDTRLINEFDDHLVTVGGQYARPKFEDGILPETLKREQYSVFVEDAWSATDDLTITGGLRYDKYEDISGEFTPRIYAVYTATDEWTVKGGIGRGFRAPLMEQSTSGVNGFGDGGSTPLFGNPNLNPERSTNVEFSVQYDNQDNFAAQATVFRNEIKDLIEGGTGANSGQDINVGRAVIQGLELSAAYRFLPEWTLKANYTYTDSELKSTQPRANLAQAVSSLAGDPFVSVPDHMLNAGVYWQTTPQLETFMTAEYRSSAFRPRNFHEPMNGGNSQGLAGPGHRDSNIVLGDFKGYTLLNLGARYAVNQNVTLNGTLTNLLNKDFIDYSTYDRFDGGTAQSNAYNNILPGRGLFVSMNVNF